MELVLKRKDAISLQMKNAQGHQAQQKCAGLPPARWRVLIRVIRGQKVMLDADLAELYGVENPSP